MKNSFWTFFELSYLILLILIISANNRILFWYAWWNRSINPTRLSGRTERICISRQANWTGSFLARHFYPCKRDLHVRCSSSSKINVIPQGVYLPISKLHSILTVANLLAHNNKFVTAVKFHYRVLQFFKKSDIFGGNIYFAGDGTWQWTCDRIFVGCKWYSEVTITIVLA